MTEKGILGTISIAHVSLGNIYILWHGVRAIVFSGHSTTMQSLLTRIKMSVFGKRAERTFFSGFENVSYITCLNVCSVKDLQENFEFSTLI